MRKKTRNETPNPKAFRYRKSPIQGDDKRLDRIHTASFTERERALEALARMKELEAKYRRKMHNVVLDERTILSSNKKSELERMEKEYKKI